MSWQLPHAPLLGRVVIAQSLGVAAIVAASLLIGMAIPTTNGYPVKAALVFGAISLAALGYLRNNHPFETFGFGNQITTLRALLVALVAALIGEARTGDVALTVGGLTVAAASLDGVDGWAARRTSMTSDFGARYDMEVDALLIMVLAILAWQHEKAGAWIVLAGALRYLFLAAGYAWQWMNAPLPHSLRRKAVCVVQIVGLGVVMLPFVTARSSVTVASMTLLALIWSFGVDVLWLRRHGA